MQAGGHHIGLGQSCRQGTFHAKAPGFKLSAEIVYFVPQDAPIGGFAHDPRLTRLMSPIGIAVTAAKRAPPSVYSKGNSGAIGPATRGPRSEVSSALMGLLNASLTAVPSKPQWAMQLSQRGFLPTPYFSHSVSSIRAL